MRPTAFAAAVSLTLPLIIAAVPASAETVSTKEFVSKATVSDMFEVQSGKLAADKAKNEDVKDFGQKMVDDHSKTTEDLMQLIKDENIDVKVPTALDEKDQAKLDKLKNASGAKFDRIYVPMQVKAHDRAVNLFEDYSKSGDNKALKTWASDTLPTLKEHLADARDLDKQLSAAPAMAANDKNMKDEDQNAMKTAMADDDKADAKDSKAKPSNINYVTRQAPKDWSAQALIGRSVKNNDDETLGDINNVIVNEEGKVVAVTIGVGGFLGLGEKDVGVPFDALKFETAGEATKDSEMAPEATSAEKKKADQASRFDSEHANMEIVLNATRYQLEKAPQFLWLDDQNDKRAEADDKTVQ
jgi:putative membrane protein